MRGDDVLGATVVRGRSSDPIASPRRKHRRAQLCYVHGIVRGGRGVDESRDEPLRGRLGTRQRPRIRPDSADSSSDSSRCANSSVVHGEARDPGDVPERASPGLPRAQGRGRDARQRQYRRRAQLRRRERCVGEFAPRAVVRSRGVFSTRSTTAPGSPSPRTCRRGAARSSIAPTFRGGWRRGPDVRREGR